MTALTIAEVYRLLLMLGLPALVILIVALAHEWLTHHPLRHRHRHRPSTRAQA